MKIYLHLNYCSQVVFLGTLKNFFLVRNYTQNLSVRWNLSASAPFKVVRQGGVLSPILFTVYVDERLRRHSMLYI